MKKNTSNDPIYENFEDMLPIRMAQPEFTLVPTGAMPVNITDSTQIYIDYLLDLGFIYSHEIVVKNAVGKEEGGSARIISYVNVDHNVYALVTNLYHVQTWTNFTSFYPDGTRIVTTSQPGALLLEPVQRIDNIDELTVQNSGSATVDTQWKKHRRLAATQMPDESAVVFKPDQHVSVESSFYSSYVQHLLNSNILQQSDTQTVRFTRSGARTYHVAITSKSARRPQPKVEQWIGKRGRLPVRNILNIRNGAVAAGALLTAGLVAVALQTTDPAPPDSAGLDPEITAPKAAADTTLAAIPSESTVKEPIQELSANTADGANSNQPSGVMEKKSKQLSDIEKADQKQLAIADSEDEMWRIAVENAEFFLLSNDGDPTPWIRTARKIAAGFKSDDSRLARTYFLAALLEPDYRIAEQQFNRALSIQTRTLGLYHAETAQTLEALAWIAEHNKEALSEAITHQRLAINIYRDIFGSDSEDTKAAQWKLQYFEDRLAGLRPKADSNKRLLPALARFSR